MRVHSTRLILPFAALALLVSAACGTVATPEWAAEAEGTRAALVSTSEQLTALAPTATPIPPTVTPIPPTATDVPPTATEILPTTTAIPTEAPTVEVTAEATAEAPVEVAELSNDEAVAVAIAAGDLAAGQALFQAQHDLPGGVPWACSSCHSVDASGVRMIGPGLWNVAYRDYTPDEYANNVEYVINSILHPLDFIAPPGEDQPDWALMMPEGWDEVFSEEELVDLVAYVLSLQP